MTDKLEEYISYAITICKLREWILLSYIDELFIGL